jgi:hypothetical protein
MTRLIYMSNWESMPWKMRVTTKQLITSLLLSTAALSYLNRQFILNTRFSWWCVDIIQSTCLSCSAVCSVQLFGWNLKSLWQTANQKRCHALLRAGRLEESYEAYRCIMDTSDKTTTTSFRDWSRDWSISKSPIMSLVPILTRMSRSF